MSGGVSRKGKKEGGKERRKEDGERKKQASTSIG